MRAVCGDALDNVRLASYRPASLGYFTESAPIVAAQLAIGRCALSRGRSRYEGKKPVAAAPGTGHGG